MVKWKVRNQVKLNKAMSASDPDIVSEYMDMAM